MSCGRDVLTVQAVQPTAGILQVQFLGEVVDAPVVVQGLVPWSQWLGCGRP